jgi:TolB protein
LIKGEKLKKIKLFSQTVLLIPVVLAALLTSGCSSDENLLKEEKELKTWMVPNIGEAAEAYFSPDGKTLICNAKGEGDSSHLVYTINIDGTNKKRINDRGEDACSFFHPNGKQLIWTSTRANPHLPKGSYSVPKDYPKGAELFTSDLDGNNVKRLTNNEYYDAEVCYSPDGSKILFSRQIEGEVDLWVMKADGSSQHQITFTPEWQEGGAFYLHDNKTIIYRAWKIEDEAVKGMPMTIFTIKDDGTDLKQITHEPGTNWSPFPAPDDKHFVFVKVLPPHNYEIFLMDMETGEQTRLTYNDAFDGFPVISPDGKLMTFSSNRDAAPGERALTLYLMDISSFNLGANN